MSLQAHVYQLPQGELTVKLDSLLPASDYFTVVSRQNPKRQFLFLSQILGKHLPVAVNKMSDYHFKLATSLPDLPKPILFIGLAETATCLAQGVFQAWLKLNSINDNNSAIYLHSTRYLIDARTPINFSEEHSHAPAQWFYPPTNAEQLAIFSKTKSLVLIDDEITTANTLANLTSSCREYLPNLKRVHLTCLTDFIGAERDNLSNKFKFPATINSLIQGQWKFIANDQNQSFSNLNSSQNTMSAKINDGGFGRCGITEALQLKQNFIEKIAKQQPKNARILVLGTGEFMFPPFVLAQMLQGKVTDSVDFFATTRSPIQVGGDIKDIISFIDNYNEGINNYLYNWNSLANQYDQVFLCHETPVNNQLMNLAKQLNAKLIYFQSPQQLYLIKID